MFTSYETYFFYAYLIISQKNIKSVKIKNNVTLKSLTFLLSVPSRNISIIISFKIRNPDFRFPRNISTYLLPNLISLDNSVEINRFTIFRMYMLTFIIMYTPTRTKYNVTTTIFRISRQFFLNKLFPIAIFNFNIA